jgi:hypothetical protein
MSAFDTCARCGGSLDVGGTVLVCSRCQRVEVRARRSRHYLPTVSLFESAAPTTHRAPEVSSRPQAPARQIGIFDLDLFPEV